jgi:putative membrane protein
LTDAALTGNQRRTNVVLWGIAVGYVIGSLVSPGFSVPIFLFPFALIHGAKRYGWKGILVLAVITLIISGIMENLSILTGFPFGHYYYTDGLGPKVFLVPLLIAPSYVSFGYLAWVLSTVLVGEVRRRSPVFIAVAVSIVASFIMVAWDLSLDPIASTIRQDWIWTQGGGYFGVPISNFIGWSFTVYIFLQLFALYVRQRGSDDLSRTVPITHYLQAILVYMWTSVGFLRSFLFRVNTQVTDAAGKVWQTSDIYETSAILAIYTMIFISILALAILFRDRLRQNQT